MGIVEDTIIPMIRNAFPAIALILSFCWMLYFLVALPFWANYPVGLVPLFIAAALGLREARRRESIKPFWLTDPWEQSDAHALEQIEKERAKTKPLP